MDPANSIYNYRQITLTLASGGQPDENQLNNLLETGYEVVINLGLSDTDYSLPNERALVESRGAQYIHIPVDFKDPEISRYFEFANLFKTISHKRIFIHCAANKRVSVFLALYRMLEEQVPYVEAISELKSIWNPDEVWSVYMKDIIRIVADTTDKR